MTFAILPNIALGFGVILVVTFSDGTQLQIPCHNRATAKYEQSQFPTYKHS